MAKNSSPYIMQALVLITVNYIKEIFDEKIKNLFKSFSMIKKLSIFFGEPGISQRQTISKYSFRSKTIVEN
jgi:hypothetical protein